MFKILQGKEGRAVTNLCASTARGPRGAALALVFVALALLLPRPFCDLAFAAASQSKAAPGVTTIVHGVAGHADTITPSSEACCANISDGTLVNPAGPLIPWLPDVPLGAALFVLAALPLFARPRHAVRCRLAAPPERHFYARSARILR